MTQTATFLRDLTTAPLRNLLKKSRKHTMANGASSWKTAGSSTLLTKSSRLSQASSIPRLSQVRATATRVSQRRKKATNKVVKKAILNLRAVTQTPLIIKPSSTHSRAFLTSAATMTLICETKGDSPRLAKSDHRKQTSHLFRIATALKRAKKARKRTILGAQTIATRRLPKATWAPGAICTKASNMTRSTK